MVREFKEFLRCGILKEGCLHLVRRGCGFSQVVALACKKREFVPRLAWSRPNLRGQTKQRPIICPRQTAIKPLPQLRLLNFSLLHLRQDNGAQ